MLINIQYHMMMTTVGLAPEIKNLRYLMSLENHFRARMAMGGAWTFLIFKKLKYVREKQKYSP